MELKAEDTLKTLLLHKDVSGWLSDSPFESCAQNPMDGSGSEDSVVSGPSSPSPALQALRCNSCERLFSTMRRRRPPRKNPRDNDPASLSCDEWVLNKRRQPRRWRRSRGRLWVHLKRIRVRAENQSGDDGENEAWSLCSRPHAFLQRNLRQCKKVFGKPSKSNGEPLHQRRNRAKRLHGGKHQRRKRRKSSETNNTSEHLSPVDLTITSEDELPSNDNPHREGSQRSVKVPKKRSVSDVSGFMDKQANSSGLEGTCRVLNFDTPPNAVQAETQKAKHCLVDKRGGAKLHDSRADFKDFKSRDCPRRLDDDDDDDDDDQCEDLDVFRTPTDHFSVDLNTTRKSRPLQTYGARKNSFRAMLAAFGQRQNKIIRESHH